MHWDRSPGVSRGAVVTKGIDRSGGSEHPPLAARRRGILAAGVGIAVVAVLVVLLAGADRRQARIHDELEHAFADTSYDDLAAGLLGDPDDPDRSNSDARFSDSEQIFSAVSVRADGFRYTDDQIELRWPAMFFGLRRCVVVTWTPSSVQIRDLSGPACTEFMG